MLRVATVVGCNYPGTASELHGCVNDALLMRQILVRTYGFKEHNITMLIDDHRHMTTELPTGANIKRELHAMVRRAVDEMQRGRRSHLCFYFSGHGTLLERPHEGHEAIVPTDHNLITDVDFRRLVDQVPPSARFTMVSDSCHSGGLIGQETEQIGPGARRGRGAGAGRARFLPYQEVLQRLGAPRDLHQLGRHMVDSFRDDASALFRYPRAPVPVPRPDSGILLSACQSDEYAMERDGYGAFTLALSVSLGARDEWPPWNHWIVVTVVRNKVQERGFTQHPCLYCHADNVAKCLLDRDMMGYA